MTVLKIAAAALLVCALAPAACTLGAVVTAGAVVASLPAAAPIDPGKAVCATPERWPALAKAYGCAPSKPRAKSHLVKPPL